jgi:hypothetical protein
MLLEPFRFRLTRVLGGTERGTIGLGFVARTTCAAVLR